MHWLKQSYEKISNTTIINFWKPLVFFTPTMHFSPEKLDIIDDDLTQKQEQTNSIFMEAIDMVDTIEYEYIEDVYDVKIGLPINLLSFKCFRGLNEE